MAFVEVPNRRYLGTSAATSPTMSIIVSKAGSQHVYIRLPHDLVHNTWTDKLINDGRTVKLGILEGTESDAGSFMLVHNPRGYTFTCSAYSKADDTPSASTFVTKLAMEAFKNYVPNVTPQAPTALEFSVDGQVMLILAPSWFIYTQKVAIRSTMVPVVKPTPGRPTTAVANQQRRLVR